MLATMSMSEPLWLRDGQGTPPTLRWVFALEAPLVAMDLGRESGEILAADESGGLYRIGRRGELLKSSNGLRCTSGRMVGHERGGRGDRRRPKGDSAEWQPRGGMVGWIAGSGGSGLLSRPFGRQTAISLANGGNLVLGEQGEQLSIFETARPLKWIQFLANKPVLVGAAEYGQVCAHRINGERLWSEKCFASLGEMRGGRRRDGLGGGIQSGDPVVRRR